MVELKILEETELVAKRLQNYEMVGEDIYEVPPKRAVKLIEEGAARTASWSEGIEKEA